MTGSLKTGRSYSLALANPLRDDRAIDPMRVPTEFLREVGLGSGLAVFIRRPVTGQPAMLTESAIRRYPIAQLIASNRLKGREY